MNLFRLSSRQWLLGMAGACLLAVAAALVAQYGYNMQPCPWCILQRAIYLCVALLCVIAAALKPGSGRTALVAAAWVAAGLGAASAVYQHVVASKLFSCNLTLADKVISALQLESAVPALFRVTATCADAAVSVFGVPFEYWSLALFVLLAVAAATVFSRRGAP